MLVEIIRKLAELAEGHKFEGDIIRDPGKFEGESIATLYFYDAYLNGGDTVSELSDIEKRVLDIDSDYVYLAESNDGFVSLEFYDTREEAEERDSEEDEFEDEEIEPVSCPMCNGTGALLGSLGSLTHYRCINCGWTFSS